MKKHISFLGLILCTLSFGQTGVNTNTPQKELHVNGSLQLTSELNMGGNASTSGDTGIRRKYLQSQGPNATPIWNTPVLTPTTPTTGTLSSISYVKGTTAINVAAGTTVLIPGMTFIHTVPESANTQVINFTITGYMSKTTTTGLVTQGVFALYQNNVKVTSTYASVANDSGASIVNLPIPVTLLYKVILPPGTYNFNLRYTSWTGTARINYVPSTYTGYNGDSESMLSKMQVMIFNAS
jgi:hypothetical protein